MNLNSFGINAYKNVANVGSSDEKSEKKIFSPVFEKITTQNKEKTTPSQQNLSFQSQDIPFKNIAWDKLHDDSSKSDSDKIHKTMNEIFDKRVFPHLNEKDFQGNESARIAAKALTSGGLIKVPDRGCKISFVNWS